MWKFKKVLPLVVLLVLVLVFPVLAAKVATLGNYNSGGRSDGTYDIEIDSDGFIRNYGGLEAKYELVTTNDTITASESSTTFVVEGDGTSSKVYLDLPDADVGTEFTFVIGGGVSVLTDGVTLPILNLNPVDTDYIYEVNSAAGTTYAAGDSVENSNGYTCDSIKIICAEDLYWQVVYQIGTWADAD